jgi:uncharacterized integral membrane protein
MDLARSDKPEWGAFIDEESLEDSARTKRANTKIALLVLGTGVLFLFLYLYMQNAPEYFNFLDLPCATLSLIVAVFMFFLGAVVYCFAIRARPWRIYDNGLLLRMPLVGDVFYQWAKLTDLKERFDFSGQLVVTVYQNNSAIIDLHRDEHRTPARVEFLSKKMGKPVPAASGPVKMDGEQKYEPPGEVQKYTLAIIVALVIAITLPMLLPSSIFIPIRVTIIILPACIALALRAVTWRFKARAKKEGRPVKLNAKFIIVVIVLANLAPIVYVSALGQGGSLLFNPSQDVLDTTAPRTGAQFPDIIESSTMEMNENFLVARGRSVVMRDCAVKFNGTHYRDLALWVENGGSLEAHNCTFSTMSYFTYSVEFHGKAVFTNCTFTGFFCDRNRENGDGGIEVWSSDVRMARCNISGATSQALLIVDCSPVFTDCIFDDCGDENVEAHRSSPTFVNCTLSKARWGIITWAETHLKMVDCTIRDQSEEGADLIASDADIRDCHFENINGSAIKYSRPGALKESGNTFASVGKERELSGGYSSEDSVCILNNILLSVSLVLGAVLVGKSRRG